MPDVFDFAGQFMQGYGQATELGQRERALQLEIMDSVRRLGREQQTGRALGAIGEDVASEAMTMEPGQQGPPTPGDDRTAALRQLVSDPQMSNEGKQYLIERLMQQQVETETMQARSALATRAQRVAQSLQGITGGEDESAALMEMAQALQDPDAQIDLGTVGQLESQMLELVAGAAGATAEMETRARLSQELDSVLDPLGKVLGVGRAQTARGVVKMLEAGAIDYDTFGQLFVRSLIGYGGGSSGGRGGRDYALEAAQDAWMEKSLGDPPQTPEEQEEFQALVEFYRRGGGQQPQMGGPAPQRGPLDRAASREAMRGTLGQAAKVDQRTDKALEDAKKTRTRRLGDDTVDMIVERISTTLDDPDDYRAVQDLVDKLLRDAHFPEGLDSLSTEDAQKLGERVKALLEEARQGRRGLIRPAREPQTPASALGRAAAQGQG